MNVLSFSVLFILIKQEAALSRRDPCDTLYQLKCCSTVVQIMQTDRLLASRALSATATFYSATFIVWYTHCSTITQQAWGTSAQPTMLIGTVSK